MWLKSATLKAEQPTLVVKTALQALCSGASRELYIGGGPLQGRVLQGWNTLALSHSTPAPKLIPDSDREPSSFTKGQGFFFGLLLLWQELDSCIWRATNTLDSTSFWCYWNAQGQKVKAVTNDRAQANNDYTVKSCLTQQWHRFSLTHLLSLHMAGVWLQARLRQIQ